MPRYEYTCANGHTQERVESVRNRDFVRYCDECAADYDAAVQLLRVPAAPGFKVLGFNSKNGYSR